MGVCGGVTSSSNASDVAFAPPSPFAAMMRFAIDVDESDRLSEVGNVPETGDVGEDEEERCGDAPRRPIIDGSRWCSCGIALNKCVMSRAPLITAAVAMSVVAILFPGRQRYILTLASQ